MAEPMSDDGLPDVPTDPASADEMVRELRRVHSESVAYWARYDVTAFFLRPRADIWSPADQVRHLTKSVRAVATGFAAPRQLLAIRFGIALRPSRTYSALRADYLGALARGGIANSRFTPRALEPAQQGEEQRGEIMAAHAAAVENLCRALARWSERALDRLRLPHPLLGKLTAREMALFTLYHNTHHVRVAEKRRRELAARDGRGSAVRENQDMRAAFPD